MPLNPNAQKLVRALRSGDYKQARSKLRYADAMCCLGVGCDVFAKETGKGEWEQAATTHSDWRFKIGPRTEDFTLPDEVREWLGFKSDVGSWRTDDDPGEDVTSLAGMNDELLSTFGEIADQIESTPELFA